MWGVRMRGLLDWKKGIPYPACENWMPGRRGTSRWEPYKSGWLKGTAKRSFWLQPRAPILSQLARTRVLKTKKDGGQGEENEKKEMPRINSTMADATEMCQRVQAKARLIGQWGPRVLLAFRRKGQEPLPRTESTGAQSRVLAKAERNELRI